MTLEEVFVLDPRYEFVAPKFHDFCAEESSMEMHEAERWFEISSGYKDSPHAESMDMQIDEVGCDENQNPNAEVFTSATPRAGTPFKEVQMNNLLAVPGTEPARQLCKNKNQMSAIPTCKKALAMTVPRKPMTDLTGLAKDTVMKKVKTSTFGKLMFREESSNAQLKVVEKKEQAKPPSLTVPTDFHHWTDKRAQFRSNKDSSKGSPFVSLAERVLKFQAKTPDRFRVYSQESLSSLLQQPKPPMRLTAPHEPQLHTAARARPPKVKSREELEMEELAKVPKFKARPLNKKIFESRGDMGVFRSHKRQLTTPMEFHFATEERCHHQPPSDDMSVLDKLDKMSITSHESRVPAGPTIPRPFNLVTEHRGEATKMKFMQELFERELEERNLRIPKANPLPFTTDFPAIPPKPQPKECTKPEPFELESLARHKEELQRRAEELARLEQEQAAIRRFHAQPLPSFGHVFHPERSRAPLTEVHGFNFHADVRAAERAEFDRKVAEKQHQYKQLKDQLDALQKLEDEKLIRALRREMVPVARPMPVFGKPFVPHRSRREPTRAKSPNLRVVARKERRRSAEQRQTLERSRSLDLRRGQQQKRAPLR